MRAYIFDYDGTLVDTMPALETLAVEILHRRGLDPATISIWYRRTSGMPFKDQVEHLKEIAPADRDEIVAEFQERKTTIQATALAIVEIRDLVLMLAKTGVLLGVCSSTENLYLRSALDREYSDVSFAYVGGIENGSKRNQIQQFLDLINQTLVFVGDSQYDLQLAASLDLDFLSVSALLDLARL